MRCGRTALLAAGAITMLAALTTGATACKCADVPYDKVVAQTPVVFDGEVVRSELDVSGQRQVTSFRVWGAVKGVSQRLVRKPESVLSRTPQRTITVISRVDAAECGWDFRESPKRLIVGATRDERGILVAGRCTMYNLNRRP
jgi:hypothetical protein